MSDDECLLRCALHIVINTPHICNKHIVQCMYTVQCTLQKYFWSMLLTWCCSKNGRRELVQPNLPFNKNCSIDHVFYFR